MIHGLPSSSYSASEVPRPWLAPRQLGGLFGILVLAKAQVDLQKGQGSGRFDQGTLETQRNSSVCDCRFCPCSPWDAQSVMQLDKFQPFKAFNDFTLVV